MEIIGRFAKSAEELNEYELFANTPVWLPTRAECSQFNSDVKGYIKCLREAKLSLC